MAALIIEQVRCKNFFKYGDNDTTMLLSEEPLSLVIGKNGCGKSTLPIDALFYNWYGKPFRKGVKLPSLVNNKTKKGLETETVLTTPERRKFKIQRYRKPDTFLISEYKNEEWVPIKPPSDLKQYQKWLEENVIRMSEDTFRQVVVLGSSSYQPFMELDTAKRRGVVEDLLTLRVYSVMNKITKDRNKETKSQLNDAKSSMYNHERLLNAHKHSLIEVTNRSDTFVSESFTEIDKLTLRNVELAKDIEYHRLDIVKLEDSINDKSEVKTNYQNADSESNKVIGEQSRIQKRLDFYGKNANCPECQQVLHQDFVDQTVCILNNSHQIHGMKLEDLNVQKEKLTDRIREIKSVLTVISEINGKINSRNQDIAVNNGQIRTIQSNINSFQNQDTSEIESKISNCQLEFNKFELKVSELEDDLLHENALLELLKDDAIKADVIREEIPNINSTIQQYLDVIGFNAIFSLDETFTENIVIDGELLTYEALSQGQKLRLNLVLMFVWREVARSKSSASCSLLVLDEVCDSSLDSDGIDAMFKLMEHIAINGEQYTLVISHSADTQSKFNVAHEVTLEQGFSTMKKIVGF